MSLSPTTPAACAAALFALALPAAAQGEDPPKTAPYDVLTNNKRDYTHFNPQPRSGICVDSTGGIWAVNPYANTVVQHDGFGTSPDKVFPTGLHPVSLAVLEEAGAPAAVLVVCEGTHGAFLHDADDGRVLGFVRLDDEPADLVVDAAQAFAYVSCMGDNTVLRVDLAALEVVDRWVVDGGQRPGALHLDEDSGRLYVACSVTGNHTVPFKSAIQDVGSIIDLKQFGSKLPDRDVHAIDLATGHVELVVTDAGSLLFDIDVNPATGQLWVLSSQSNNTLADNEPDLNGQSAVNQLVLADVAGATGTVAGQPGVDLDDVEFNVPGPQYDRTRSLNQARTLAFLDGSIGAAFVGGPLSDVISMLKKNGKRLGDFQLPAGSECHALEVYTSTTGDQSVFLALDLGAMKIHAFRWAPYSPNPLVSLDLGPDPTPDQIRRGRSIFLDGQRSADARTSCATCHPDGMSDQLGWSLQGLPCDVKDIQVTQSLLAIADTFPHHWREERDLEDFRKAWPGLLGAPPELELTEAEMRDVVAYIHSLEAPPNPVQNPRRLVDDSRTPDPVDGITGSAVDGQGFFQDVPNFNENTCAECHLLESGTNGNMLVEVLSRAPLAANTGVAHLRQLVHRGQEVLTVTPAGTQLLVNEDGFGTSHNGTLANLDRFVRDGFALSDEEEAGITNFMKQWDQGVAPACTWGAWLDADTTEDELAEIEEVLFAGEAAGWNDIVAIGAIDDGSGILEATRWVYDAGEFVNADPAVPSLTWTEFLGETKVGRAEHALFGVPPGNAFRVGSDSDLDGVGHGEELLAGTDPWNADTDGDGWPDGHELENGDDPLVFQGSSSDDTPPGLTGVVSEFVSARTKKFSVEFSEPCTYVVEYGAAPLHDLTFERGFATACDTFVLTHSLPSTPGGPPVVFGARITLTDRAGNVAGPFPLPEFISLETQDQLGLERFVHVAAVEEVAVARSQDSMLVRARIRLDENHGAPLFFPADGMMVFSIVAVDRGAGFEQSTDFATTHPTTFDLDTPGNAYTVSPGPPWLVSDLTEGGSTVVQFTQPNLSPGDVVKLSVMGATTPTAGQPTGVYDTVGLGRLQQLFLEDARVLAIEF